MNTFLQMLASCVNGSLAVMRWSFNSLLALFLPLLIVSGAAWVTDSSGTLFWASVIVRAAQLFCGLVLVASCLVCGTAFLSVLLIVFTGKWLGVEQFKDASL